MDTSRHLRNRDEFLLSVVVRIDEMKKSHGIWKVVFFFERNQRRAKTNME